MPIVNCGQCGTPIDTRTGAPGESVRCQQCGNQFVIPGKKVREIPINRPAPPIPTSSQPGQSEKWYMRSGDGTVYDTGSKQELDAWFADGRISAECQLRRESDPQWRWASEVYPQLRTTESSNASAPLAAPRPMQFNCPHCEASLEVSPSQAGQQMACSFCEGAFAIPLPTVSMGNNSDNYYDRGSEHRRKDPAIAALLSFLWPGAGQIFADAVGVGVSMAIPALFIFLIFLILPISIFLFGIPFLFYWGWGIFDAYKRAEAYNNRKQGNQPGRY